MLGDFSNVEGLTGIQILDPPTPPPSKSVKLCGKEVRGDLVDIVVGTEIGTKFETDETAA